MFPVKFPPLEPIEVLEVVSGQFRDVSAQIIFYADAMKNNPLGI